MNEQRVARVRAEMQAHGLTQMIISDSKSIWYLTGASVEPYERLMALYLPVQGEPVIFLNKLFFVPQAPCREVWHTDSDKPVEQIAEVVDKTKTLGIDKEWLVSARSQSRDAGGADCLCGQVQRPGL